MKLSFAQDVTVVMFLLRLGGASLATASVICCSSLISGLTGKTNGVATFL